jgi:hypothetical protein
MLLITPPFTQLNTPYPATPYLKGFLNTLHISSHQLDLGLEIILNIFNANGLRKVFQEVELQSKTFSENTRLILNQKEKYINTIEPTIRFLQNRNQTLALLICSGGYLPKGKRLSSQSDLEWAFGTMGTHDMARHLATLYLEDIGDVICECIDSHFGFSRYAEKIARTASGFDELYNSLNRPETLITKELTTVLQERIDSVNPKVVCLSVPFPGNLFGALKCGQFIKKQYPAITIIMGGGFVNTELRRVQDVRLFEFVDFLTLDDGEAPLKLILDFLEGKCPKSALKRTFCIENQNVTFIDSQKHADIPQADVGTPDYSGLPLDNYLSVIEIANPMHRLWSDGRWNKLTLAHGCYWGKCSFCDVTLDYIKRYEPSTASTLCDRIEAIIAQTGQHGFHFVDEAAPPALLRDLALEILRRQLTVVWWTNVRFEKRYTLDLCRLLKASGCIAVSGGLEVASDRLLKKMNKGVSVEQVSNVAHAFTQAGIMVHAYLMYGFPTQTEQETVDSLEIVRQLFEAKIIQSGFWHQFALTAHSLVGKNPEEYGITITGPKFRGFAENDFYYEDSTNLNHDMFSEGLKISLYNYMHGVALDEPLQTWFNFRLPKTTVALKTIEKYLQKGTELSYQSTHKILWLGGLPVDNKTIPLKKSKKSEIPAICYSELTFQGMDEKFSVFLEESKALWLLQILEKASPSSTSVLTLGHMESSYCQAGFDDFQEFLASENFISLRRVGLLIFD